MRPIRLPDILHSGGRVPNGTTCDGAEPPLIYQGMEYGFCKPPGGR